MANPTLVKAFDSNGTNTTPITASKQTDGFLIGETVPSNVHNELFKQSIEGLNKSRNDGIWEWENPSGGNTTYNIGSLVRHLGVNYESLKNANTVTPTNDLVNWKSTSSSITSSSIHAATSKTTPVDADELALLDSTTSFSLKRLTWANLKASLVALFAPLASPAFTGTPTAPTATVGTNTTQLATTAFVKAKSESDSIGINQTWQNVFLSRSLGVTYTNTTGRPITVIYVADTHSGESAFFYVDGLVVARHQNGNAASIYPSITVIVPANSTYRITKSAGGGGVSWYELR